jgi:hypothetical protein
MARKKVIDLDASTVVGFGKEQGQIGVGKEISGYYIGCRKVQTSMGESTLHFLQQEKGNLGVWGSAQLNAKLGSIAPGTMVFITYTGKVKHPKGTMKKFSVEFDDEDSIDVGGAQLNFRNNDESSEEDYSEEEGEPEAESEEEGEPEAEEEEPAPVQAKKPAPKTATAMSPAAKAKVNALLGKKS